jgi:hypothetical protein
VRLPTLTAWSLPELISSYAVVLPTLYELQKSSTLNAAFDIWKVSAVIARTCAVTNGIHPKKLGHLYWIKLGIWDQIAFCKWQLCRFSDPTSLVLPCVGRVIPAQRAN